MRSILIRGHDRATGIRGTVIVVGTTGSDDFTLFLADGLQLRIAASVIRDLPLDATMQEMNVGTHHVRIQAWPSIPVEP